MQASDQPPDNTAGEINLSSIPPQETNAHMEELFTGRGKRLRDPGNEMRESENPSEPEEEKTPEVQDFSEVPTQGEATTEKNNLNEVTVDQPTFEHEEIVKLSFAEMYAYLHGEVAGKPMQQVSDIVSADDYLASMFEQVYRTHPHEDISDAKQRYPNLEPDEIEQLWSLFILEAKTGRADSRRWRNRLYEISRAVYKSTRSLNAILEHRIATSQVNQTHSDRNLWAKRADQDNVTADGDVDMTSNESSKFRFLKSVYSTEEITELRQLCETPYGFPTEIRMPTNNETKVIKGLLEGTILCADLPAFLKRVCTNSAMRMIQNTIQAQVEGDLVLRLSQDFPVYPDFQTRDRLISMILLKPENGRHDKNKIVELLRDTKQICYDSRNHTVHLIFWTRELATNWSKTFKTLPFRNKVFKLENEHPDVQGDDDTSTRGASVWARQVGPDGIRNEKSRDRYHVRLLNISRFMDEAAIDTYIQQHFKGVYTTWQEPTTRNRPRQTDTWEIYFKSSICPSFLVGRRFIDWNGTKILIHHVSAKPTPPCFQCGDSGHTRMKCNAGDDFWKNSGYCITVTDNEITTLPTQQSTVTSFEELSMFWIDQKQQQQPNGTTTPRTASNSPKQSTDPCENSSNVVKVTPPKSEWQTVGNGRKTGTKSSHAASSENQHTQTGPRSILQRNQSPTSGSDIPMIQAHQEKETEVKTVQKENKVNERSIAEEIRAKLSVRSQAMEKQLNLINNQVKRKKSSRSAAVTSKLANLNIETFGETPKSANDVIQASGLEAVDTPANGNCQYYAIAMELLQGDFKQGEISNGLETLTAKIKRGIKSTADHYFDEEYPHDIRLTILSYINKKPMELTEKQSKQAMQSYLVELSKSNSQQDGYIDEKLWGTSETLRLTAKFLHRNFFCIVARPSMNEATYTIYEPKEIQKNGKTFTSAAERFFRGNEPGKWLEALKQERAMLVETGDTPMVIIFKHKHYEWLRFTSEHKRHKKNYEQTTSMCMEIEDGNTTMEGEDEPMHIAPTNEDDPPAGEMRQAKGITTTGSIGSHKREKKEELKEVSTEGIEEIQPGQRQELRNLKWTNEAAVAEWLERYQISLATLQEWQIELIAKDSQSTIKLPEVGTQQSNETDSLDENEGMLSSQPPTTESMSQQSSVIGRLKKTSLTANSNRTTASQTTQNWNNLKTEWAKHTTAEFPSMPTTQNKWKEAAEKAPAVLTGLLRTFEQPRIILSDMTDSTLDCWTLPARYECLLHCLDKLQWITEDETNKQWIRAWIDQLQHQAESNIRMINLHPRELWTKLKKLKYAGIELLKLCRKGQTQQLSRLILTSTIYNTEIRHFKPEHTNQQPSTTIEHLDMLFAALANKPELQPILQCSEPAGVWTELETRLAASMQLPDPPDECMGSSSPTY